MSYPLTRIRCPPFWHAPMVAEADGASDTLTAAIEPIISHLGQYWLDSGTLLGLLRDGGIIGWDSDIDLAIWDTEVSRVLAALPHIKARGYAVSTRTYRDRLYGFTMHHRSRRFPPVHIHVYFKAGHVAWSPQTVAYSEVDRPNATAGFAGTAQMRRVMSHLKQGALSRGRGTWLQRAYRTVVCLPIWGGLVVLRYPLERQYWSSLWPFSIMYATYTWIIPIHFFEGLRTLNRGDIDLVVPANAEAYLEARYGAWRVPKQDWCYWTDDGCIVSRPPEVVLAELAQAGQ